MDETLITILQFLIFYSNFQPIFYKYKIKVQYLFEVHQYHLLFLLAMSKKQKTTRQKQINDHHFANNIFFNALSTLQSLKLITENKHKENYRHKLFKNYDKIDYSSKTMLELQSQLQTHLTVFRASMKSYLQDYKHAWSPPENFNTSKASEFILEAYDLFNQRNEQISSRLTNDFIQLIQGQTNDLFIDYAQIKGNYSQFEKKQHRKNLYLHSTKAQEIMEEEKQRIQNEKIENINDLKANLNPNHGSPIYYRYLITTKEEYNQYFKDNIGFDVSMIDKQLYQNKEQVMQHLKRCKSLRKNNDVGIELEICNDTVFDIKLLK